jgi:hypothetical protein
MVKPMILKGSKMSHSNGKIKINKMAIGQQITNRIHQSMIAINVRMQTVS